MSLTRYLEGGGKEREAGSGLSGWRPAAWLEGAADFWRYPAALLVVAISGAVAETLFRLLSLGGMARILTAGVLVSAFLFGVGPAVLASAVSFLIYTTLLTAPRVQIQASPGEDMLLLIVFLTTAVLTGGLAGRVRAEVVRARARNQATSALYEASRELSVSWEENEMRENLVRRLALAAEGAAVIVEGDKTHIWPVGVEPPSGLEPPPEAGDLGRTEGWNVRALRSGSQYLGVAAWRPDEGSVQKMEGGLIEVMADLGAAAIARARLGELNTEMAALARAQQLQNALLSSISHDFRTPLSSILASTSALRELGDQLGAEGRGDLLATIQEEAERLNTFVANLLSMMRLDGGALLVNGEEIALDELCSRVAGRFESEAGRKGISLMQVEGRVTAFGDPMLLEQALFNVVHNAISFSPANRVVKLEVVQDGSIARLVVTDDGPGVPAEHIERIFDKFFRSKQNLSRGGTGLGLSIARGLVDAMGGRIYATNGPQGGLCVTIELQVS